MAKIRIEWSMRCFMAVSLFLVQVVISKEIDSKQDLQQEESAHLPAEHRSFPNHHSPHGPPNQSGFGPASAHPHGSHSSGQKPDASPGDPWPLGRPDVSQIKAINVKCDKSMMKVNIEFDRPFYGLIFSKGHYSDPKCAHLPPGSGQLQANFEIYLGGCGMTSSEQSGNAAGGPSGPGLYIENVIIIQYDPQVQEIWDQARRLRCTWYDYYEKAVTFRPFNVDMLDAVTANFLGDNIQCWMQIQVGKGPWASEVAGIVKIGQTMTMVLAIKDDDNKFDMIVRNCIAHDGKHQPIQLVDEFGCVVRPKVMSRFQKVKNFGHTATVVSYAYFQAFKFPDSMNVHFQCVIQVCRFECPEPVCEGDPSGEYVPAPRDQSTSFSENKPIYHSSQAAVNKQNAQKPNPNPSAQFPSDILMNRKGEIAPTKGYVNVTSNYAIANTGGMPRSLKLDSRRKRQTNQMKDVKTEKVIQVVAPGDMAFALPLSGENDTAIIDNIYSNRIDKKDTTICISTAGFTAGLVFLLLLLVISCLISAFLFMRLRNISKNVSVLKCTCVSETPFVYKMPSISTVHIATVS